MTNYILKHKLFFVIAVFGVFGMAQSYYFAQITFSVDVLSDIVTFLSILFGFYITSLAIFVTSSYVSTLYGIVDKNQQGQTLLDTLTSNYRFGFVLTLLSLVYFIGVQFVLEVPETRQLTLGNNYLLPVLAFLVLDFVYCYLMLKDLISIIVQEGKSRNQKLHEV